MNKDPLISAPQLDLPCILEPHPPLPLSSRLNAELRGDDRAANLASDLLEPARDVHNIANDSKFNPLFASKIAHRHRTKMDADRHTKGIRATEGPFPAPAL